MKNIWYNSILTCRDWVMQTNIDLFSGLYHESPKKAKRTTPTPQELNLNNFTWSRHTGVDTSKKVKVEKRD